MKTVLALTLAATPFFVTAQEDETNHELNDLEHGIKLAAQEQDPGKLTELIDQAATIDLRAALSYAAQHEIDGAIIGGKWRPADAGLSDAFAVAITSPESSYRHHLILGLINNWVKSDHSKALTTIKALPASPFTTELIEQYNLAMVRSRPSDALTSAFANLGKPNAIKVRDAAYSLAKTDLKTALERIPDLPRENPLYSEQVIVATAKTYAQRTPEPAAKWAATLGHENEKALAYEEVAYAWSADAPDATADWVKATPAGPARDAALRPLVFNTSPKNPAKAFQWALLTKDAGLRETLLSTAVFDWSTASKEDAMAAIGAAELPDALKKSLTAIAQPAE